MRFSLTVGGEALTRLWDVEAGAANAGGLMEGALKENAEGAAGVSEGGLEVKEKVDDPEPKGADPPRENAEGVEVVEQVVGTEKVKLDVDDDTGAAGTMLNGALEDEGGRAGAVETAADVKPMFGNGTGAAETGAAILAGCVAKEPVRRK